MPKGVITRAKLFFLSKILKIEPKSGFGSYLELWSGVGTLGRQVGFGSRGAGFMFISLPGLPKCDLVIPKTARNVQNRSRKGQQHVQSNFLYNNFENRVKIGIWSLSGALEWRGRNLVGKQISARGELDFCSYHFQDSQNVI